MVLLERLGEILVHLSLDALLSVTHHGVCCKRNDRSPLHAEAALVLSDSARRLKSTLYYVSGRSLWENLRSSPGLYIYHDGHLHVHQDDIELLVLYSCESLCSVSDDSDDVVVFLEDLDGELLVDRVVFCQQDLE